MTQTQCTRGMTQQTDTVYTGHDTDTVYTGHDTADRQWTRGMTQTQ